ncbi:MULTISPECIES: sugar ABC transporter permease [Paenibacillus]|uniref:Protein lplB n=1 Tax=Paenibacillus amylolyticus TaxID=1451 RepID=A0A1R1BF47_PAEAM|nr:MULTISPECIES: ABC transporter permease subunit [Paenibacillus]OME44215.1 protein lplB [Paenibacillus odorifer]OMF04956.1 protein lplB [Paenibacillus amylolyticus]PRA07797.1 sugar ABC transporter permease [Paenibacillus sp. MYb63]PRA51441.1 sugar ABC transporter permease [Paenibacillus sp. MYb67]
MDIIQEELFLKRLHKQLPFHLFVGLGILFLLVFSYIPMFGIIIAFKNYKISTGIEGIFTSSWAGLSHFRELINDYNFPSLVRNTLILSVLKVIFSYPIPILFAIMLSEVKHVFFKRFVQTVSYLPHFISWVVVTGIAYAFFSSGFGIFNELMLSLHIIKEPVQILTDPDSFYGLAVMTAIWKEAGWWTIIFLAALAGIDPALYEAAEIDGAGRLKRILYITLPGLKSASIVVLILTIGSILGGGLVGSNFEQSMLLGNPLNNEKSQIIQTYAFSVGLAQGRFSFATAIDLMQSVISVFLIFTSNFIAKRFSGTGLF